MTREHTPDDRQLHIDDFSPMPFAGGIFYTYQSEHVELNLMHYEDASQLHISWIRVEPAFRGQGYGDALLDSVLAMARGLQARTLTASIITPEGYDLFARVFGTNSLGPRVDFTAGEEAHFSYPVPDDHASVAVDTASE